MEGSLVRTNTFKKGMIDCYKVKDKLTTPPF